MGVVQEIFKETKNLRFIKESTTTEITDQSISYRKDGESPFIACGGSTAVTADLLEFASAAPYLWVNSDSKDVRFLLYTRRGCCKMQFLQICPC